MWRARLITQLVSKLRHVDGEIVAPSAEVEPPPAAHPPRFRQRTSRERYRWPLRTITRKP